MRQTRNCAGRKAPPSGWACGLPCKLRLCRAVFLWYTGTGSSPPLRALFLKSIHANFTAFLFLLYDILVKKSIIEEGVCIMAKILIVDDEPRIRELIREHLQYSGYICEEAADGTAALTQLSGGAFDLVILDLMMPFMDGMTCLREMRARHINTPVIILTARGEEYDKLAGLESGADATLSSPSLPVSW